MNKPEFIARISAAQIVPYDVTDLMIPAEDEYRQIMFEGNKKTSVKVTLFYRGERVRVRRIVGKKKMLAPIKHLYDIFVEPDPSNWPSDPDLIAAAGSLEVGVKRLR